MSTQLTPDQVNWTQVAQWRAAIKQAVFDLRCASPAFLTEDVNANTQTVTAQIAMQERVRTPQGAQWWDTPPIFLVPLILPRGGGYSLTLPLKKGDEGLLVFCDTCFDLWWQNAQTNSPKASNSKQPSGTQQQLEVRRHHIHDCGFIPGMCSQPNKLSDYSSTAAQLRRDDGSALVEVADGAVTVKQAGGDALPLLNDNFYQWFLNTFMPAVQYKATQPTPPEEAETTILKGQ